MPSDATGPIEYLASFTDADRLRVRYSHRRGVPVEFTVQLECLIGGTWLAARRYDTHTGLHLHTAPWDRAVDRRVPWRGMGSKEAMTMAIRDITANWERYRAACEAARGGE